MVRTAVTIVFDTCTVRHFVFRNLQFSNTKGCGWSTVIVRVLSSLCSLLDVVYIFNTCYIYLGSSTSCVLESLCTLLGSPFPYCAGVLLLGTRPSYISNTISSTERMVAVISSNRFRRRRFGPGLHFQNSTGVFRKFRSF